MGASSSTMQQQQHQEENEIESLAASTGSLPMLRNAFSILSDDTKKAIPVRSLQDCFCLNVTNVASEASSSLPDCFMELLVHLGPAIVDLFFTSDEGGVHWVEFLRGYVRCCGRMSLSMSINNLYRLYAAASGKAVIPSKLDFESDDADSKISGSLMPSDVLMLLWMCWIMSRSSRIRKLSDEKATLILPDINHLIFSAITLCNENSNDLNFKDCNILTLENHIFAQKFHHWVSTTVPGLAHCFSQYVHNRLQKGATSEEGLDDSNLSHDCTSSEECDKCLLTCGRAWAIHLSLRDTRDELLSVCFPGKGIKTFENLLYRSSLHGKGLNRFWSNTEGYHGVLLILLSASSIGAHQGDDANVERWVISVLTQQGFESRDTYYGSSAYLYAISPIFHVFPPSGKDKNFVYSHLHPTGRVYEAHPKTVGIAFGGTVGNERIFIDEDFARVTVRHHAVDKTYQPGSLVPNQGFLPVEASIIEVEVWGLGGKSAKEQQDAYKKREQIFTDQRRKIDLKTLAWEDSPEKMMMDMVSDPNRVQREDR
ncbi:uncharacterized protein LOC131237303 [Magnolia sinica]|uniref:uncharacterized protein LOC131237303 n=1 Tax=Magnolia sinica TaxID=86752 RepID=UPI00265A5B57|nr:uncharacterized protein LOC131237303 [Magnolia sinica]